MNKIPFIKGPESLYSTYDWVYNYLHPHLNDETLTSFIKKKHPRKGEKKKTRGKNQSLGKQTTQKRLAKRSEGNH